MNKECMGFCNNLQMAKIHFLTCHNVPQQKFLHQMRNKNIVYCFQKDGVKRRMNVNNSSRPTSIINANIHFTKAGNMANVYGPAGPKLPILTPTLAMLLATRPYESSKLQPTSDITIVPPTIMQKQIDTKDIVLTRLELGIALPLTFTCKIAVGCNMCRNSYIPLFAINICLITFKPPLVEPAHPPAINNKVIITVNTCGHREQSHVVKPVVVTTEIIKNMQFLIDFSNVRPKSELYNIMPATMPITTVISV